MLRSSLGFHTITLSLPLLANEANQLIADFCTYREKAGNIEIYRINEKNLPIIYYYSNYLMPLKTNIKFKGIDRGIRWCIRESKRSHASSDYMVEVTINPKILAGVPDYLTASTYIIMGCVSASFDRISQTISPLLHSFSDYRITRIDYCVNIALDEFISECDPMQIMNLIKRSDIPPHYEEWMKYDDTAHRMKSRPESFYLKSNSVNINYYSKYLQLLNVSKENVEKGYNPVDPEILDTSRNIFRFEVQCKYYKIYSMSQEAERLGDHSVNKYKTLLEPIKCIKIISDYYARVIGKGDWYTLSEAIQIIKSKGYYCQKEDCLIQALKYVSQCRSLAKAKASCPIEKIGTFTRTLNQLEALNINPVTIPREWHIDHIPNLLRSYLDQLLKSSSDLSSQNMEMNYYTAVQYRNYYEKFGSPI